MVLHVYVFTEDLAAIRTWDPPLLPRFMFRAVQVSSVFVHVGEVLVALHAVSGHGGCVRQPRVHPQRLVTGECLIAARALLRGVSPSQMIFDAVPHFEGHSAVMTDESLVEPSVVRVEVTTLNKFSVAFQTLQHCAVLPDVSTFRAVTLTYLSAILTFVNVKMAGDVHLQAKLVEKIRLADITDV